MKYFVIAFLLSPSLILLYHIAIYRRTRVPIIITPKKYYQELFKGFPFKKDSIIYELGCGRGDFLFAAEIFSPKKSVGLDLSFVHIWQAKIRALARRSKIKFLCKNYFEADIKDADIIYIFSVQSIVIKTWEKIKKETKAGTVVIVLSDTIPGEIFFQKIPTQPGTQKSTYYYLYKI
jgi:SAM-dependent methyltransferase